MLKYIIELRNRLLLLIITYFSSLFITYLYKDILLILIIKSNFLLHNSNFESFYFIFTAVTEMFSVYIQLIFFINFQIGLIFIFYHLFIFFSFALFKKEYIFFKIVLKIVLFTWIFSSLLANYIIIPLTWNFFLSFQDLIITKNIVNIHFEAKIIEYFYFYINLYYTFNIYFQIIVCFILFLNYFNINLKNIKKYRKLYYFIFIMFSAILTLDVISQCLISVFFIIMYEILIFFFLLNNYFKNLR
jgi:sec-independent protein translocase protein TatC